MEVTIDMDTIHRTGTDVSGTIRTDTGATDIIFPSTIIALRTVPAKRNRLEGMFLLFSTTSTAFPSQTEHEELLLGLQYKRSHRTGNEGLHHLDPVRLRIQ
jgi:hypothetical protein